MKNTIKISLGLALALVGFQVQALSITGLNETDCLADANCYYGPAYSPANPSTTEIQNLIFDQSGKIVSLFEIYKENVGDGFDSGRYAGSYSTTFTNSESDPEDATLTWGGSGAINCPECFLLVKAGNQDPSWYVFDISTWDGMETIYMTDFWVGNGAISHFTIFDDGTSPPQINVPEPSIIALLSLGLIGIGLVRRKVQ